MQWSIRPPGLALKRLYLSKFFLELREFEREFTLLLYNTMIIQVFMLVTWCQSDSQDWLLETIRRHFPPEFWEFEVDYLSE